MLTLFVFVLAVERSECDILHITADSFFPFLPMNMFGKAANM